MKTFLVLLFSLSLVAMGFSQAPAPRVVQPLFTSDELDQIVAPIALYPDPLISLMLPASTMPSDVAQADRYLSEGGDPAQVPNQPWDDSVKGLTHYPDVLKWMDQNLDWTSQLGSAFLAQPGDVMDAIQQMRVRAQSAGTLVSNLQQQVGMDDDGDITIEPANPDAIYVPQYDPNSVYDDEYDLDDGSLFTYGDACAVGPWLGFWPDWHHHGIYRGQWSRGWNYRSRTGYGANANRWHPNPDRLHVQYSFVAHPGIAAPRPLPGARILHGSHTAAVNSPGLRTGGLTPPSRDFTGRGVVVPEAPRAVARPVVVEPSLPPAESAISGYGRGSDARAASERGQFSRQFAAPTYHAPAPAESFGGGGGGRMGSGGGGRGR
jgi:hypothetical protein